MTPLQSAIWQFLSDRYSGPESATPRSKIIGAYNAWHQAILDDRTFRQVASDLVIVFKKPICTSPSMGYFVANSVDDRDIGVRALKAAGATFFERARQLEETIVVEYQGRLI